MAEILGDFKEGIEDPLLKIKANEPLKHSTIIIVATPPGGMAVQLPAVPTPNTDGIDDNEFQALWDIEDLPLGTAQIQVTAEDRAGLPGQADGTLTIKSSYGRNYAEAYGDGL